MDRGINVFLTREKKMCVFQWTMKKDFEFENEVGIEVKLLKNSTHNQPPEEENQTHNLILELKR